LGFEYQTEIPSAREKGNILRFLIGHAGRSELHLCTGVRTQLWMKHPDRLEFRCFSPLATIMAVVGETKPFRPGSKFHVEKLMS